MCAGRSSRQCRYASMASRVNEARASVAGTQEVRLRLRGIECDRAVEAVERLAIAVLLLEEPPEVEDREQEVRRNPDRFLQQELGVVGTVQLDRDQREQPHRVDIARVVAQHAAIEPLGLVDATLAMMLGGVRHHAPLGRALEASLEGGIRLLAAAEQGERLAEREPGALERGIEARRLLEEGQGVGRRDPPAPAGIRDPRGLREGRRRGDDLAQQRFGFLARDPS